MRALGNPALKHTSDYRIGMHHRQARSELICNGLSPANYLRRLRPAIHRANDPLRLRTLSGICKMRARPYRNLAVVQNTRRHRTQQQLPESRVPLGRHRNQIYCVFVRIRDNGRRGTSLHQNPLQTHPPPTIGKEFVQSLLGKPAQQLHFGFDHRSLGHIENYILKGMQQRHLRIQTISPSLDSHARRDTLWRKIYWKKNVMNHKCLCTAILPPNIYSNHAAAACFADAPLSPLINRFRLSRTN